MANAHRLLDNFFNTWGFALDPQVEVVEGKNKRNTPVICSHLVFWLS